MQVVGAPARSRRQRGRRPSVSVQLTSSNQAISLAFQSQSEGQEAAGDVDQFTVITSSGAAHEWHLTVQLMDVPRECMGASPARKEAAQIHFPLLAKTTRSCCWIPRICGRPPAQVSQSHLIRVCCFKSTLKTFQDRRPEKLLLGPSMSDTKGSFSESQLETAEVSHLR